ncbi:MAG: glycosyltransferase family 1 protein, partial [Pseudomonadota bacterium]
MTELAQGKYDVLVVADPRFSGGSTGALVADVSAFSELGLNIGLLFVRSAYLHDSRDRINPAAAALTDLPGVTHLSAGATATAEVAFLHHPMVFYRGIEETASLSAQRAYIITHHAPFRADGSVEFDPTRTLRNVKASLGLRAAFAPISGIVRGQLASFAPFVTLSPEDWPNVFDPQSWPGKTPIFLHEELTIGRHGRPDMLKWPATQTEIANSLPASEKIRVRVLGCPTEDLGALNVDMAGWEVIDFGAEPVADFLNSLDVFVYHFSPSW